MCWSLHFFTLIMLDVSFVTKINLNFSKKVRFWRTGPTELFRFGSGSVHIQTSVRSGPEIFRSSVLGPVQFWTEPTECSARLHLLQTSPFIQIFFCIWTLVNSLLCCHKLHGYQLDYLWLYCTVCAKEFYNLKSWC